MTTLQTATSLDEFRRHRLATLHRRLADRGLAAPRAATGLPPGALTSGQERLWLVHTLDEETSPLAIAIGLDIEGPVDVDALVAAHRMVVDGHDVLRTTYPAGPDGRPVARTAGPGLTEAPVEIHDLSALPGTDRRSRREVLMRRAVARGFDLATDLPLRLMVLRDGPSHTTVVLVVHHMAWDDDCWDIYLAELSARYRGVDPGPTVQFAACAPAPTIDAECDAADAARVRVLAERLAELGDPLELPGENGPTRQPSPASGVVVLPVPDDLATALHETARAEHTSVFALVTAAVDVVLTRYCGTTRTAVAIPVGTRTGQRCLGYLGNTVVQPAGTDPGHTLAEVVATATERLRVTRAHADVDLDRVVRAAAPRRDGTVMDAVRVSVTTRGDIAAALDLPDTRVRVRDIDTARAQIPLTFVWEQTGTGAAVRVEYLTDVLAAPRARDLGSSLLLVLEALVGPHDRRVRDLEIRDAAMIAADLRDSTGGIVDLPATTLPELVAEAVRRDPRAEALVRTGRRMTYSELADETDRIARHLLSRGVPTGALVAISARHPADLALLALGILKAGAAYLPVDPSYPDDRIAHMLADSAAGLVLVAGAEPAAGDSGGETDADAIRIAGLAPAAAAVLDVTPGGPGHRALLDAPAGTIRPEERHGELRPEHPAYVIYTSGSTGLPKGVLVAHAAICDYLRWIRRAFDVGPTDTLLQVASTSFDVSVGEIFGTLSAGARLIVPDPGGLEDVPYLTRLLEDENVTSMHFVPSLLGLFLLLPDVHRWTGLTRVPVGGEALPGDLADRFRATLDAELTNFYGPTEAILACTHYPVRLPQGARTVPIGRPVDNTTIHILDAAMRPVPRGVPGEVYVGGRQLADGYLHRPALTAKRFVADPFSVGGRLYRTGDLARRDGDGDIEFLGRVDDQVKIRGLRVELGEVSAALTSHPDVSAAVATIVEHPARGPVLVGYVVTPDAESVAEVLEAASATLPPHMVPEQLLVVPAIPVTANGKLDRDALPVPEATASRASRAPATDAERRVAAIVAELLGREEVGADESFFDLGGHSLLAVRLVARLSAEFGIDLAIREAFDTPTVAGLARRCDDARPARALPALRRRPESARPTLSPAQLRMWFLDRIGGGGSTYLIPFAAEIDGPVDASALGAAVRELLDRHDILRTVYPDVDGTPYQEVLPVPDVRVPVEVLDPDDVESALARAAAEGFDLATEIPVRARLWRLHGVAPRHVLSLVIHHIAADEACAPILMRDLVAAYRRHASGDGPGDVIPAPATPAPTYRDFSAWQNELVALGTDVDHWKEVLADLPEDTLVGADHPRPPLPDDAGATVTLPVPAATRARLRKVCATLGISEFMAAQTAVALVLHRLGAGRDIPLGTPVSGRTDVATHDLVGLLVNTVVLRNRIRPDETVRTHLLAARAVALDAYEHQDVPFDVVVDALAPERSLSRHPLFQVLVTWRDAGLHEFPLDAAGATTLRTLPPRETTAKFDLTVDLCVAGDDLTVGINYRTALFESATAAALAGRVVRMLDALCEGLDRPVRALDVLAEDERASVHRWGYGPSVDDPSLPAAGESVTELLTVLPTHPRERAAVVGTDTDLSYGELDDGSAALARLLAHRGVGPGHVVAISLPRTPALLVALVAVMRSGAAFLPLDPRLPPARKEEMVAAARPAVVLVSAEGAGEVPAALASAVIVVGEGSAARVPGLPLDTAGAGPTEPDPGAGVRGTDPAYVLFTSGSTGIPKAVLGSQRAMAARLAWQPIDHPVADPDVRLAQGSLSFLDGGLELLAGVIAGATLVFADDRRAHDLEALGTLLSAHPVRQVTAVPSAVSVLVDHHPEAVAAVDRWVCSGEPLGPALLAALRQVAPRACIVNSYGATESAGAVIRGDVTTGPPRVGRPVRGMRVRILDEYLRPVPPGMVGEVHLSGPQVAVGYLGRPGLTATRFLADPDGGGGRMYRTGDRARFLPNGEIAFAGRTDHQVKIRGFRVELGEIETIARAVPGVAAAAATTVSGPHGDRLAAFVVPARGTDGDDLVREVRAAFATHLPGHAIPAHLQAIDALPATASGKIHRPGLPVPDPEGSADHTPARTPTERLLAAVVEEVLGIRGVGRDDSFFGLGGDSISSVRLAGLAGERGALVSTRMVFEHPTIGELAAAADAARGGSAVTTCGAAAPLEASGLDAATLAGLLGGPNGTAR